MNPLDVLKKELIKEHINDHGEEMRWLRGCTLDPEQVFDFLDRAFALGERHGVARCVEAGSKKQCSVPRALVCCVHEKCAGGREAMDAVRSVLEQIKKEG